VSVTEHPELFKGEWIAEPARLKTLARRAKYNDMFTAELAAWCAEIHEHLRELETDVGVQLILMGGNGASLRFDAVQQRGSRDNDYLTVATREDIKRLMDAFAARFAALHPLFVPRRYEPIRKVAQLDMVAYVIPVELRLDHGRATSNEVKVEFHFEHELPPAESVLGSLGPADVPVRARVPELPYQFVLKLMTLVAPPVGIDEERRVEAVPRQLYDLDLLLAAMRDERQWEAMVAYCRLRYEHECAQWSIPLAPDQPVVGLRERLARWADCTDSSGERWKIIRAVQQSQLRREVHRTPWGWRARSLRLGVAIECSTLENGWAIWQQALATAAIVPPIKAKRYKGALAELAGVDANSLPLELHDFAWDALGRDTAPLPERVARAYEALTAV
jgi:hypothetical protein